MAKVPTTSEMIEAQKYSAQEIEDKTRSQLAQGKEFIVDDHGHAPGVVPEDVWQAHKEPSHE